MKYFQIAVFALFLFAGCAVRLNYDDVSGTPEFKKWIGREFKIKEDVFLVEDPHYDKIFIMAPDSRFPSVEQYKANYKEEIKWNIFLDNKIIGVSSVGDRYKIIAIGYHAFSSMIGKIGILVVKDNFGKEYYIRETDLFYFKDGTLLPDKGYIEMLQESGTSI